MNSSYLPAPPPVGGDVEQDRDLPFASSAIKITARGSGRDGVTTNTLSSVLLEYRKDAASPAAYTNTPMRDDGIEGDALANDGIYTAFLPPAGSPITTVNGDLLEFRIMMTDPLGSRTLPATNRVGAPGTSFSYLAKFAEDPQSGLAYPGEYDTYHMLMTKANRDAFESRNVCIETPVEITLIAPGGKVIHNCGVRLRGSSSRNGSLGNYRIGLPPRLHDRWLL